LQYFFGPRFFIPSFYLPEKYNYKREPLINENNLEEGEFNCVICLTSIEKENDIYIDFMVAPCDHVFHDDCLKRWMQEKMGNLIF
jgi:hypothetical protein